MLDFKVNKLQLCFDGFIMNYMPIYSELRTPNAP